MGNWPFKNPGKVGVIALHDVLLQRTPILHVCHDADDGAWQFLGLSSPMVGDTTVVSLEKLVSSDPTLDELGDLPLGWHAWRKEKTDPWTREPMAV
jgi:hypothetical protein